MADPYRSTPDIHVLPEQFFPPRPPEPSEQPGGSAGEPVSPQPAQPSPGAAGDDVAGPPFPEPSPLAPPTDEPPAEAPQPKEPPSEEPPPERHDPFAWMRGAPRINRKLSPLGRAAALLRRDLEAFPVIEGRDPNHADLDAIVKRTVDYIVPIIRRERATDMVYEELEKRRADRIAKARAASLALPAAREVAGSLLKEAAKRVFPYEQ